MAIKSQQDVKNATKEKENKIPKSMEGKFQSQPSGQKQQEILPIDQKIAAIEAYLSKVDQAFVKISEELSEIQNIINAMKIMDSDISKLTGDVMRLTKLSEDRYIELATAINQTHDRVATLDEYLPAYIDTKLNEYFDETVMVDDGVASPESNDEVPQT